MIDKIKNCLFLSTIAICLVNMCAAVNCPNNDTSIKQNPSYYYYSKYNLGYEAEKAISAAQAASGYVIAGGKDLCKAAKVALRTYNNVRAQTNKSKTRNNLNLKMRITCEN